MTVAVPLSRIAALLSDPTLRARVERIVRARIPDDEAVKDIVQDAFLDATVYESRLPKDDAAAKKYLFGIVRNKIRMHIRDWFERTDESFDEEIHGAKDPPPVEARELVQKIIAGVAESRWQTFMWFVRVTFGDSLAEIAREEGVGYATAHARYLRMRADLRRRANELTTVVAILLLAFGIAHSVRLHPDRTATPDVRPVPSYVEIQPKEQSAADLRRRAFAACDAHRWGECLDGFDAAARLDPAGDGAPDVRAARNAAERGLLEMRMPDSK